MDEFRRLPSKSLLILCVLGYRILALATWGCGAGIHLSHWKDCFLLMVGLKRREIQLSNSQWWNATGWFQTCMTRVTTQGLTPATPPGFSCRPSKTSSYQLQTVLLFWRKDSSLSSAKHKLRWRNWLWRFSRHMLMAFNFGNRMQAWRLTLRWRIMALTLR